MSAAQAASATPIPIHIQPCAPIEIESTDGTRANAAASARFRSTPSRDTLERGPKQAQGAPARPRSRAETVSAANIAIRPAAA